MFKFALGFLVIAMICSVRGEETKAEKSEGGARRGKSYDTTKKVVSYQNVAQSRDTGYGGGSAYSPISSGYSAPVSSGYAAPSSGYAAPSSGYSVPSYETYSYEEEDDEYKKKKALAIALPIALLAPFAAVGLLAIFYVLASIKAVFGLAFLRILCANNTTLAATNLCTVVNSIQIGRDGNVAPTKKIMERILTSDNIGQFVSFLHSRFNIMDHLKEPSNESEN